MNGGIIAASVIGCIFSLALSILWVYAIILAIRYMKKKLKESNAVAAKETESRTTDDLEHQAGHDGSADPAERENGRVKTVRRSGRVQALPAPTLSSITLVILLSGMVAAEEPHDSHPTQDHSEYDDAPGPICIVSLIAIYLFMAFLGGLYCRRRGSSIADLLAGSPMIRPILLFSAPVIVEDASGMHMPLELASPSVRFPFLLGFRTTDAFAEAHKREQHACRGGLSKVATLVHRGDQELTDPNLRQSRQFVRRNPAIKLSRAVLSSTLLSIYVLLFASPAKAKSSASHDYVLSRHFNLSDEHEEDIKWVILICGPILAFVSLACFLTFASCTMRLQERVNILEQQQGDRAMLDPLPARPAVTPNH
ncbi:hypothetical protein B0J12DRAFT_80921 [Macrophomina phaseolina]|uniref:Transmembrane protein n=1 Tax=Macrophomina phaseolina TaxID=35725 RepID=A0ABQ8GBY5_9PEZI|nr:hypothetical protein B0J12DRAFT_80921 [Macrophomina phaseolina]